MKRTIVMFCCLFCAAAFAQNIPADSLDYYRKTAHRLLIDKNTSEAVELYKKLALSGDALSGYQLYELYSQGQGVPKDEIEAVKWQEIAQNNLAKQERQSRAKAAKEEEIQKYGDRGPTLEDLFHESGTLIARGAKEKNAALAVGIAGEGAGIVLMGIGMARQSRSMGSDGKGAIIAGYATMGASAIVSVVLGMVGNHHIKQGGELMRRVHITGGGVSVSF